MSFLAEDGAKLLGALAWATVPALIYGERQPARRRDAEFASSPAD